MSKILTNKLFELAKNVSENSYSPYSKFKVGCAFVDINGNHHMGTNVENASYGLTCCAERNAIFSSFSKQKNLSIDTLVVYTPTQNITAPCGACRQVINEFSNKSTKIILVCDNKDKTLELSIDNLLPISFGSKDLNV